MKIVVKIFKWLYHKLGGTHYNQFLTDDVNHFLKYDYSYQLLIDNDASERSIITNEVIKFKDNIELGCSKKIITNVLGNPQHIYHSKGMKGYQILFYKKMINGYRTNAVMHIYQNQLMLGMYLIKTSDDERERILFDLKEKYTPDSPDDFLYSSRIVDSVGNVMKIEDYNYLTIGYLNSQDPNYEKVSSYIRKKNSIKRVSN